MKTTMKKLAAGTFVALILLVGNVNAEGTEVKASSHEALESKLQLEKWMTDESIWNSNSANFEEFLQETETSLEIENWMTSEKTWNMKSIFVEETEAGMDLEGWMLNENNWNLEKMNFDTDLTVENWMLNLKVWE